MSASPPATNDDRAAPARHIVRGKPLTLRRVLKWVALILVGLLLLVAMASYWAWTQRYSLLERQVITYLESQGIEADLSIDNATRTRADISNIRMSHKGERFLSLDRLEAEYQWRDLIEGRVERLVMSGLVAKITVDARGNVIDGWRPPSSGGDGFALPPRGIVVNGGMVQLTTPYGVVPFDGSATIDDLQNFRLTGDLGQTRLARDGASAVLTGPIELTRAEGDLSIESRALSLSAIHPQGQLTTTTAQITARYADGALEGAAQLQGGQLISTSGITAELAELSLDGRRAADGALSGTATMDGGSMTLEAGLAADVERLSVVGTRAPDGALSATVTPRLRRARVTDPDRARDLARTLSLSDALSAVPVAQHFAPEITPALRRLLSGSDVDGEMRVSLDDTARSVTLSRDLTLVAGNTRAVLSPLPDAPLYQFATGETSYAVRTTARLNRPLPLRLAGLAVDIRSDNGIRVGGVAAASGRLSTQADWNAPGVDGVPARLGPLSVAFDYSNPDTSAARLTLRGEAAYDGEIPGGVVSGLMAGGTLSAVLREGRPSADFKPKGPLSFAQLTTTSDWSLRDFTGTLDPITPLYARAANGDARIQAKLADATFTAFRGADTVGGAAELDMQIGSAELSGQVRADTQNWDVSFTEMALQSETVPVPGTDLVLPSGTLAVALSQTERTRFEVSAPSSTLRTPGYLVQDMAIEAQGTAEDYALDYSGGRVRLIPVGDAAPLPVLPASGSLRFAGGVFTGEATTRLPKADDQPVGVTYRIVDGRGEAVVDIDDLRFAPGKLQPQELAPALRGKIAQVDGLIDADLLIRFGGGEPFGGTGTVDLKGINFGTAPGPVTGLSGRIELTSLFPVVTAPDQSFTIGTFDPGFPLADGEVRYALRDTGVEIASARFPLGAGSVTFDPFTWVYAAKQNRVVLRVADVDIADFIASFGNSELEASGTLSGEIPVVVEGIDVRVEKGRLAIEEGGTFRFSRSKELGANIPNEYAGQALSALENFDYDRLFVEIDGPLDGEIMVGMEFTGKNDDVLYGVPFAFDVTIEGELFNIARSLNPSATDIIKRKVGEAAISVGQ